MCNVLSDIEIAQGMLAKREESEQEQQEQVRLDIVQQGVANSCLCVL
jgi:hypothetical protein